MPLMVLKGMAKMQNPGQATENHSSLKRKEPDRGKIEIVPNECKGCGLCEATCPIDAISLNGFNDEMLLEELKAFSI